MTKPLKITQEKSNLGKPEDEGVFFITGDLDYSNVMELYRQSLPLFVTYTYLNFDLSKINSSNSAGLALVLEWIKCARRNQKTIRLQNLSPKLLAIAKISGLEKMLGSYLGSVDN